eukprot:gene31309-48719_t
MFGALVMNPTIVMSTLAVLWICSVLQVSLVSGATGVILLAVCLGTIPFLWWRALRTVSRFARQVPDPRLYPDDPSVRALFEGVTAKGQQDLHRKLLLLEHFEGRSEFRRAPPAGAAAPGALRGWRRR